MIDRLDPESGSLTVQTAAIILCCAILGAAAMAALAFSGRALSRSAREAEASALRSALIAAIGAAVAALESDSSPESDSPLDAAYSIRSLEGIPITISEASSALNPNWLRKGLLEDTSLSSLLKPGTSPADLQQYREDEGLSQDLGHYADFFSGDEAMALVSTYSYPCIGACDEFALRRLCLDATGDSLAADALLGAAQAQLKTGKAIDEAGLRGLLGLRYDALSTVVTAQAQMNVNFLPEKILKAVVGYSAWGIPDADKKWQAIALSRESSPISKELLLSVLKLKADHPVFAYLGTRSFFWRIEAESEGLRMEAIAARALPFDQAAPEKGLTLVSMEETRK